MVRRWSELPLSAKGVLVVAIPMCALFAAMAGLLVFERQSRDAQDWVDRTYSARSQIRQSIQLLSDSENAMRGYGLTRRQRFLDRYRAAEMAMPAYLAELRGLMRDNSSQLAKLDQVDSLMAQFFGLLNNAEPTTAGIDAASALGDTVREILAGALNEENRLLSVRRARERDAEQRLESATFAGGTLGLLGGLGAILIFTRRIAGRLRLLDDDARHVAEGLPMRADIPGNDEIARLGRTLKSTSELIAAQTGELRADREMLEARVAERTAELQAANERLQHSTRVLEAIIGSSPLAIWAADLEGNVTFWNQAAAQIYGWNVEDVLGRMPPVIAADDAGEFHRWLERFRHGDRATAVARRRQRRDGSIVEVMMWSAPLRDADGNVYGTIMIDSDLTGQRLLEEQFRQSQKLEAVGRLAGGVAHDFNNLLTVITGYVEMLISDAGDSHLVDYAREVQYAAGRAGSLTAQLLAFSRRQISQPRLLDLNEVVEHSMKLLRRVIGEDVETAVRLDTALGKVKVDPIHIDQLLMNLVVNARDAMPHGGRLLVETAEAVLDEHYADRHMEVVPGRYAMLAISDTGTGMSAETRSHLFEPFFTTKEAGKGTGLGLSIVYGIVKQAGGHINVYSEPGKGTAFKIYLPLAAAGQETDAAASAAGDLRGTETILLCEDEGRIRKLVETILARQGYTVLAADTPSGAIETALRHPALIDLLLTDVVMPGMNGFDLAGRIRGFRPEIKVLLMSGYTDAHLNQSGTIDPEVPFLQKPFTATALLQNLRDALGARAAAR